jgi:hypothetical protein
MISARLFCLSLLSVTLPLGCTDSQAPAEPRVEEIRVSPATTNAAITSFTADHYVYVPLDAPERGTRIMLLLPGTGGAPSNARDIAQIAARQGYRAIGLMYVDDRAVVNECVADADLDCMAHMREEIITGNAVSPHVDVDAANSIDGRLASLLTWLAAQRPSEHWEQFLMPDGSPKWDAIAVGGLSQGGGHAAYIARLRVVPRVVMFGAPADGYDGAPAPWMQIGATPAERYYGFHHQRDPFTSIDANWIALGLPSFGAAVDVTASTSDFRGSHMFTTDLLPATGTYAHAHPSVFGDAVTPRRSNGSPMFEGVWRYLLGTP